MVELPHKCLYRVGEDWSKIQTAADTAVCCLHYPPSRKDVSVTRMSSLSKSQQLVQDLPRLQRPFFLTQCQNFPMVWFRCECKGQPICTHGGQLSCAELRPSSLMGPLYLSHCSTIPAINLPFPPVFAGVDPNTYLEPNALFSTSGIPHEAFTVKNERNQSFFYKPFCHNKTIGCPHFSTVS